MSRYRAVVLLLCVCLIAFKALSSARFVESAMVRAHVYASYHDPLSFMRAAPEFVKESAPKVDPSSMVSFHYPGILLLLSLSFVAPSLRSHQRPVIRKMISYDSLRRIYKPPKVGASFLNY